MTPDEVRAEVRRRVGLEVTVALAEGEAPDRRILAQMTGVLRAREAGHCEICPRQDGGSGSVHLYDRDLGTGDWQSSSMRGAEFPPHLVITGTHGLFILLMDAPEH